MSEFSSSTDSVSVGPNGVRVDSAISLFPGGGTSSQTHLESSIGSSFGSDVQATIGDLLSKSQATGEPQTFTKTETKQIPGGTSVSQQSISVFSSSSST